MAPKINISIKSVLDILASKASLLILGSVTLWLGYLAAEEMHERYKIRQEISRLKEEITAFEQRNGELANLINSFEDPKVVELEAKKRLNLKNPGEEVAVILQDSNSEEIQNIAQEEEENSPVKEESSTEQLSNPARWLKYLTE